jgi:hypothetical protein
VELLPGVGKEELVAKREGYLPTSIPVELVAGKVTPLFVTLKKAPKVTATNLGPTAKPFPGRPPERPHPGPLPALPGGRLK